MIPRNLITFPFYVPRLCRSFTNWPLYLANYVLRRKKKAEYRLRNGYTLVDGTGTLAGTIAVVFIRREYGSLHQFRTIVDIGANMGSFAVYAAQQNPAARIYCYEPSPQNFTLLKQNIAINSLDGRITAFQCAVASTSGQRDLAVGESPLNTLLPGVQECPRLPVDCVTVGDIFRNNALDGVDLMKINCEGAEYEILENLSPAEFGRISNFRLEYHNLGPSNRTGDSLAKLLQSRGYKIGRFTRYPERSGLFKESGFIWASRGTV